MYLGPDDYETVQKCFGKLYKDYGQLKEIHPANCNSPVKVFYRSCADGKQRRIDSGNSSSRSTFPIPDSPEHTRLLGNMLVISKAPVWTHEDSRDMKHKYEKLVEKNPIARSEFAKMNLGNQGRENLTICDLQTIFQALCIWQLDLSNLCRFRLECVQLVSWFTQK